uniref:Uncharacterized protein n=1 Tax=Glossina austeni TaxID=7395 RepID=A0A1A9V009_GLOAU
MPNIPQEKLQCEAILADHKESYYIVAIFMLGCLRSPPIYSYPNAAVIVVVVAVVVVAVASEFIDRIRISQTQSRVFNTNYTMMCTVAVAIVFTVNVIKEHPLQLTNQ